MRGVRAERVSDELPRCVFWLLDNSALPCALCPAALCRDQAEGGARGASSSEGGEEGEKRPMSCPALAPLHSVSTMYFLHFIYVGF